ncbi:MAG: dienelactone hydrolase family protein [Gammaproteobacteria bacterium]|nr:dienelactone hydrolase family protein [Gammaproteobacteria bacterium]
MNSKLAFRSFVLTILGAFACTTYSQTTEEHSSTELADSQILQVIEGAGSEPTGELLEYYDEAKGYLAVPEGDGPFGSIILIHEWNGLVTRVKQVADALAQEGYLALAADLYSGRTGSNPQENMALVRETRGDPNTLIANLNAAVQYLKDRSDSNGQVATIGWCFGGGVALTFAMGGEHHDGTAIFYGQLLYDPEELGNMHHEFHGTFAGQDRGPTVEQVQEFAKVLRDAGIPNDIHIYDPVQHGFWLYVERDLETNKEPAKHAWGRLKSFFDRILNGENEDS